MTDSPEQRLAALGLALPEAPVALANYVPALVSGDLLFVSGQIARKADGSVYAGQLGGGLSVAQGQDAARACALAILAQAKQALGTLDRIEQVVRLTGFVASAPNFFEQPQVINGASDLMFALFGENGRHARTSVGVANLPANASVEVDGIFEVS